MSGELSRMPAACVRVGSRYMAASEKNQQLAKMLSCLEKAKEEPEPNTTHPQAMVATGVGLAALPNKLVEKIKVYRLH